MKKISHSRIAILSALAAMSLLGDSANAEVVYVKTIGGLGTGDGQFSSMGCLAVGPGNLIYAVDTAGDQVEVFNTNGTFIRAFGSSGTGDGQFTNPQGIAIDANGHVYVSDTIANRVQCFNSDGSYMFGFGSPGAAAGQFTTPTGIAIGPTGLVYVCDSGNDRIQIFDFPGDYQSSFGSTGTGNGQFSFATGIEVIPSTGRIVVLDEQQDRAQIFNSSGTFQSAFASPGSVPGIYANLSAIGLSSTNSIYIADWTTNCISRFSSSGTYQDSFGNDAGPILRTKDIAISPTGEIFVANYLTGYISKWFDPEEWVSGSPHFDSAAVGPGDLLGASCNISENKGLVVDGALAINIGGSLSQSGPVSVGSATNSGQYTLNAAQLTLSTGSLYNYNLLTLKNGAGIVGNVTNTFGATLKTENGALITGNLTNSADIELSGILSISGTINNFGTLYLPDGAVLEGGPLNNDNSGVIHGEGTITSGLNNYGLIEADGTGRLMLRYFIANANTGTIIVQNNASITLAGAGIVNNGLIALNGPDAGLSGDIISNSGIIQGQGRVSSRIYNSGVIRAQGGQLLLSNTSSTNTTSGQIQILSGASIVYSAGLLSNAGLITLAGGTFDNNSYSLSNTGSIEGCGVIRTTTLSNTASGKITIADGPTSFYGNVNNSGAIVIANAPTTFFGAVTINSTGSLKNTSSTIRFLNTFTNNGVYISDPADNYFTSLSIGGSGALIGGSGDRFIISGNLTSSSANLAWNTAGASLQFTGAGAHTLDFTAQTSPFVFASVSVDTSNTLTINGGALRADTLDLRGSAKLSSGMIIAENLTLTYPATLDLFGNPMALDYSGQSPEATWLLAIKSHIIHSSHIPSAGTEVVALADNNKLHLTHWRGQIITDGTDFTQLLFACAYLGDANLDGLVDPEDYIPVLANLGHSNASWMEGDMNSDGLVTLDDLKIVTENQGYGTGGKMGEPLAAILGASNMIAVPEPATSLALLSAGAFLLRRRNKRN